MKNLCKRQTPRYHNLRNISTRWIRRIFTR